MSAREKADRFRALHAQGCFVIPNPWDLGTARVLAASGALALATSSSAFAFTRGLPDGARVSRDEAIAHAAEIDRATALPVSADLEHGFADEPEGVAETVRLAAEAGIAGCSIEDVDPSTGLPYPAALARARIAAAVAAARAAERALGRPFTLTARADGLMTGGYDEAEATARLCAFEAEGADVLYAPLPADMAALGRIVAAVGRPVNALAYGKFARAPLSAFAALGVRRVSIGSALARATHSLIRDAAAAMLGPDGDFTPLATGARGADIDALLEKGVG